MYKRILVPFYGSAGSWNALHKAIQLAEALNAEISILSVIEPLAHYEETIEQVQAECEQDWGHYTSLQFQAVASADEQGVRAKTEILVGQAAKTIIQRSLQENVELIVIGHCRHSGITKLLLGSTTMRVVDHARCDVLVVR